jgi:hypothetical protein
MEEQFIQTFSVLVLELLCITLMLAGLVSPLLGQSSNSSKTMDVIWHSYLVLAGP